MPRIITILGFGAVGRETASLLCARGETVRVGQRSAPRDLPKGAAFVACDVLSAETVQAACKGADTVVLAAGLPYRDAIWERDWPIAMRNTLDACEATGARLVFADNLYMYGPQTLPLREDMPLTTYGRKPRVRAAITRSWQEAHAAGRVRATAVRASDFYGPQTATSVLSHYGIKAILAGKRVQLPYSPDLPHDFTYVPDFARAVGSLIDAPDEAFGQAWHVPNAATRTLRQHLVRIGELIGMPPKISVLPNALRPLIGLFVPEIVSLAEMRFQTDRPYHVDASKFGARFWSNATTFDDGFKATIASYR